MILKTTVYNYTGREALKDQLDKIGFPQHRHFSVINALTEFTITVDIHEDDTVELLEINDTDINANRIILD